jgi:hypothetical protein
MIWIDVPQNTIEWEQARLGKVTASNFAAIMANNPKAFGDPAKRYALQVALEIVTGRKAEYSFRSTDTDRGHDMEPLARALYEEQTFTEIGNGGFFDCGKYGASPDGLVGTDGVIEIKSVIASVHEANILRGGIDPTYRWQMIGELECSGREWLDFVSYCSDFPEWKQLYTFRIFRADIAGEAEQLAARREDFLSLVASKVEQVNFWKESK